MDLFWAGHKQEMRLNPYSNGMKIESQNTLGLNDYQMVS